MLLNTPAALLTFTKLLAGFTREFYSLYFKNIAAFSSKLQQSLKKLQ
ncbi:protein of unknown function [Maridesulfovibrio hydrothermalis AM13 = DSM 14728]|uniref:Uncharacterized protein n=1 Tax=Maridesulfovibrio hydrothermalis AM13 = DSM 14728 TaxID=1121451 RepID=L0RAZ2_9BACT|nr:protein of unknown function [Maridesulfovibrio hydrothermalis AM13 = DSM 14728]